MKSLSALLVSAVLCQACSSNQPAVPDRGSKGDVTAAVGSEGGACYPNMTCNTDLACRSGVCVKTFDASLPDQGNPERATSDLRVDVWSADLRRDAPQFDVPKVDVSKVDLSRKDGSPDSLKPDGGCKSNADCDDKLSCTTDICGVGGCAHVLSGAFCLISQQCVPTGTINPSSVCQKCDPTKNDHDWTILSDGTPCDDKIACTYSDKCAVGTCKGTAYTCSSDGLACTTDSCNGFAPPPDGCSYVLQPGNCLIGGKCYSDGAADPSRSCFVCNSGVKHDIWLQDPSTCYLNATCYANGAPDPTKTCFKCAGNNTWKQDPTTCYINGTCYSNGGVNPANACEQCDPSVSPSGAWSYVSSPTCSVLGHVCSVPGTTCGNASLICRKNLPFSSYCTNICTGLGTSCAIVAGTVGSCEPVTGSSSVLGCNYSCDSSSCPGTLSCKPGPSGNVCAP